VTLVDELVAAFAAASDKALADRRALIAAELAAELDSDEKAGAALDPPKFRQAIQRLRATAAEVRANPDRLAAALALGGPIPTVSGKDSDDMTLYGDDGEPMANRRWSYDHIGHGLPADLPSTIDGVPVSFGHSVDAFTADGRALSIAGPVVEPAFAHGEGSNATHTRVSYWTMPNLREHGFEAVSAGLHEINVCTPEGVTPSADVLAAVCRLAMTQPAADRERRQSKYDVHA